MQVTDLFFDCYSWISRYLIVTGIICQYCVLFQIECETSIDRAIKH